MNIPHMEIRQTWEFALVGIALRYLCAYFRSSIPPKDEAQLPKNPSANPFSTLP